MFRTKFKTAAYTVQASTMNLTTTNTAKRRDTALAGTEKALLAATKFAKCVYFGCAYLKQAINCHIELLGRGGGGGEGGHPVKKIVSHAPYLAAISHLLLVPSKFFIFFLKQLENFPHSHLHNISFWIFVGVKGGGHTATSRDSFV